MIADWLHIDWDLFHFLRLEWLWLFVPMVLVLIVSLIGRQSKGKWQNTLAKHLRPYMIGKGNRFSFWGPLVVFSLTASLMIIAAAGPTWKLIEVPGAKSEAVLLIGMDLSTSMLVDDVSPNRLERAKFKVRDLLEANPRSKVGLFAFAGTAHPVVTPCTDYKLVAYQLESLSPATMPLQGTDLGEAMALADTILARTEAPSVLLLVTDNIEPEDVGLLTDFVANTPHRIEVLALATPAGGRVVYNSRGNFFRDDNGNPVISKLDQSTLFQLQQVDRINVNTLTLDKTDVEAIASYMRENLFFQEMEETTEEDWEEMGFPLLWLSGILLLFWFRKGWMISWCIVLLVFPSCNLEQVESWPDWWYTRDYQGQLHMDKGEYDLAAEAFEDPMRQGIAYFKAGNYEGAIFAFSQDSSANGQYNLALAYAENGQYDLARAALLKAEELDPGNEQIQMSLQRNDELKRQVDSLNSLNAEDVTELKEEKKGELVEREAKGEDEELTSDTEVDELPEEGDRITDEVETDQRKAEEMEFPPEDFQPGQEEMAQNILLRQISASPSEFLRKRFRYQYLKYFRNKPKPKKKW